jgi:hypothetical protein
MPSSEALLEGAQQLVIAHRLGIDELVDKQWSWVAHEEILAATTDIPMVDSMSDQHFLCINEGECDCEDEDPEGVGGLLLGDSRGASGGRRCTAGPDTRYSSCNRHP